MIDNFIKGSPDGNRNLKAFDDRNCILVKGFVNNNSMKRLVEKNGSVEKSSNNENHGITEDFGYKYGSIMKGLVEKNGSTRKVSLINMVARFLRKVVLI